MLGLTMRKDEWICIGDPQAAGVARIKLSDHASKERASVLIDAPQGITITREKILPAAGVSTRRGKEAPEGERQGPRGAAGRSS